MIEVTVKGVADFGRLIKDGPEKKMSLPDGSSYRDLLVILAKESGQELKHKLFPDKQAETGKDLRLLLNGRDIIFLDGLETELKDGDRISILPLLGGG